MKIGILGGSFNPAHKGHLKISLTAIELLNLDKVYWLITKKNPLKTESEYLPFEIRCKEADKIIDTNRIELMYTEQKTDDADTIAFLRHGCITNRSRRHTTTPSTLIQQMIPIFFDISLHLYGRNARCRTMPLFLLA